MFDYPVTLTPDGHTVLVTFADVPEAITFGADEEEALLQAVDALESGLSFYVDARKPLPAPSKAKRGQKTVRPGALEGAKLGLYQAMTAQGVRRKNPTAILIFLWLVHAGDESRQPTFSAQLH